jgi:hypothetical protein
MFIQFILLTKMNNGSLTVFILIYIYIYNIILFNKDTFPKKYL